MKYVKKIFPYFTDERGEMSHLLDSEVPITSVLYVTSKKGSIRANHYHKKDLHYVYIIKGKMEYTFQAIEANDSQKKTILVEKGDIVCTLPMTMHAMKFLEDSIFLAFSIRPRNKKAYEKDTVRIKLV